MQDQRLSKLCRVGNDFKYACDLATELHEIGTRMRFEIVVTLSIFVTTFGQTTRLASSGGNCTLANEPGIFEDVSQYTDWIKGVMTAAGYDYQY
ncbi:hypothetical protein MAR_028365 [Mya arenaria]|uniref:Peptidase S1 domain-containing protein n=1 Tax=Mya arenaria TaxID=6604 RepID=A0ABY7DL21_MYAAR|nr:hypothetical protein MAR_028365 [Mya arenaria]